MINCPKCENIEMVWNGDDDIQDGDSSLICHICNTIIVVYYGNNNEN